MASSFIQKAVIRVLTDRKLLSKSMDTLNLTPDCRFCDGNAETDWTLLNNGWTHSAPVMHQSVYELGHHWLR